MKLVFNRVTTQNFMSVGDNPVVMQLDTQCITGIFGANGSGKSSLTIEAIGFCLFNKSFRGMSKPKLVNTTNKKGTLVTVDLMKGDTHIVVSRGIKPDVFTIAIDGKELDQTNASSFQQTLEKILGFDFGTFIRTTMLGNANYVPFMVMKASARREFVESVLDLGVFTELNKVIKADLSELNSSLGVATADLASKRAVLAEKVRSNTQRAMDNSGRIQEAKNTLAGHLQRATSAKEEFDELMLKYDQSKEISDRISAQITKTDKEIVGVKTEIHMARVRQSNAAKMVQFFENNDTCPTCKTELDPDQRFDHLDEERKLISTEEELIKNGETVVSDLTEKKHKLEAGIEKLGEYFTTLEKKKREFAESVSLAKQVKTLLESLQKVSEPEDLTESTMLMEAAVKNFSMIEEQVADHKVALELLKDGGVKAKMISDMIPMLNKLVNECLEALSIGVRLEFDEEFSETLVGRYADEFDYASLSQGERARINLAVMFAWQQLQSMASGVQSNLLIIDEVGFADLDDEGVDAMLAILRKLWQNQSVFIICHNPYAHTLCDQLIRVGKVGGFTKII